MSPREIGRSWYAAGPALLSVLAVAALAVMVVTPTHSAAAGRVPFNETAPTISGTPAVGQTLRELHGQWSPRPTSYEISWLRCDGMGNNCADVSDGTSTAYTLTAADAGHSIEAAEYGGNAAGRAERPGTTPPTEIVYSGTPYRFTLRSSIGYPQFAYYLVERGSHRPTARDWRHPTGYTVTAGHLDANLAPGETLWFQATTMIGVQFSSVRTQEPAGVSGVAYHVPSGAPRNARVVMPAEGPAYQPGLSSGELWVLGQLNRKRRAHGEPPLHVSRILDEVASVGARAEATRGLWPDPFIFTIAPSFGWPGDLTQTYMSIDDAPLRDPRQVLAHWDGATGGESSAIWSALGSPFVSIVGLADGGGAWNIVVVAACPVPDAASACQVTNVTGL